LRIKRSDTDYWYEIYGEGETIVLLHGFTGSTDTWSHYLQQYQSTFKIILIDLPGHGKTVTESPITMEQCCEDIHAILAENQVETFHLVGYSMGGRIALTYAMLYQHQLQSLVLESASPGLELVEEREERIKQDELLATKIEQEGLELFIDYWENIPLFTSQKQLLPSIQERIRKERLSQTEEGLALSLRSMGTGSQPSWWAKLSNLNTPVLLLAGELDKKFVAINKRMQKRLQNSTLKIISNTGHAIHVEQAEIFGKIVEEFILEVSNT
jgi:2-succinyl-6-hydroxy-2,4-cyclohexadiene-1-carboxylate synthase